MSPGRTKSVLEIATAGNARELGQRIRRSRERTPAELRKMMEPKETQIQQAVIRFFLGDLKGDRVPGIGMTNRWPELIDLYAVPNEGARSASNASRMKAEGLHKSMCDLCLPAPKGPFHGLYLEAKRPSGKVRADQAQTIARLAARGYAVAVFRTVEEGIKAIVWYLERGPFRRRYDVTETGELVTEYWRQELLEALKSHLADGAPLRL